MTTDELYQGMRDRIGRARTLAVSLGKLVGRVSKYVPNKIDEENLYVYVVIDPETYYSADYLGKMGILLGSVDIRTLQLVLLRVVGYERSDVSSSLFNTNDLLPKLVEDEDPGTLISNVILKCEMLTRLDPLSKEEAVPADIVIEPQSPVIIPASEIIERALGINRGALKLGYLDYANSEAKVGIGPEELNFHSLVVGTTGAGKTSFIKNLISSILLLLKEDQVMVLDATGDYYHSFLPPDLTSEHVRNSMKEFSKLSAPIESLEMDVIFPITRRWLWKNLRKNGSEEELSRVYYRLYLQPLVNYLENKGMKLNVSFENLKISVETEGWRSSLNLHPFFFSFKEVKRILHRLNPYFSEQASHFLKILTREFNDSNTLDELIHALDESTFEKLQIHKSTRENILRGLYLLRETGLFDLRAPRSPFSKTLKSGRFLVVDLYNQEPDDFSQKILAYYFLDRTFQIRETMMKKGEVKNRLLIVIDEAHRFFPSNHGWEEDSNYVRRVASKISTMMRLGRRRKIGFLFSTHNPSDLSDIVVQLANTKLVFRTSAEIGESLGLTKSEAKLLSWEKNGVAYMISPWLRQGKLKLRIPIPPPIGHYDLSRT